jgi:hypothetical protein
VKRPNALFKPTLLRHTSRGVVGSEVLFSVAAGPSRELLNQNHTKINNCQCPFESEVRDEVAARESELRIRDTGPARAHGRET